MNNIDLVNNKKYFKFLHYNEFYKIALKKGWNVISDITEYINAHSKLIVKCSEKHKFLISKNNIGKRGCPVCSIYNNELYTKQIIEYITGKDFKKIRPNWLKNKEGNNLEIDLYNEELNLAIEYNGIQHYKFISYFHKTQENFEKRKNDDIIKEQIIKEKGINYIIISYKTDNIYEYIIEQLEYLNIPFIKPETPLTEYKNIHPNASKVRKIISDKKGELIEGIYITRDSPIKIKCEFGHIWETKMGKILNNSWCHTCGYSQSEETKQKISSTLKEKIKNGEIKKPPIKQKQPRIPKSEKKCTKCNIIKSIDKFTTKSDSADGYQPWCKECTSEYKKEYRTNLEYKFECDICKNKFKELHDLKQHQSTVHSIKVDQTYVCDYPECKFETTSHTAYNGHMFTVHTEEGKEVQKKRVEASKQKTFELSQEKINKGTQKCNTCNIEKPFNEFHYKENAANKCQPRCKLCDSVDQYMKKNPNMSFEDATKKAIDNINKRVEQQNNNKFKCLYCTKTFSRSDGVTKHVDNIHPDKIQEFKSNPDRLNLIRRTL